MSECKKMMEEESTLTTIKALLDAKADPCARTDRGETVLHSAVKNMPQNSELVKLLLQYRADPNIKDANNISPLHIAVNRFSNELIERSVQEEQFALQSCVKRKEDFKMKFIQLLITFIIPKLLDKFFGSEKSATSCPFFKNLTSATSSPIRAPEQRSSSVTNTPPATDTSASACMRPSSSGLETSSNTSSPLRESKSLSLDDIIGSWSSQSPWNISSSSSKSDTTSGLASSSSSSSIGESISSSSSSSTSPRKNMSNIVQQLMPLISSACSEIGKNNSSSNGEMKEPNDMKNLMLQTVQDYALNLLQGPTDNSSSTSSDQISSLLGNFMSQVFSGPFQSSIGSSRPDTIPNTQSSSSSSHNLTSTPTSTITSTTTTTTTPTTTISPPSRTRIYTSSQENTISPTSSESSDVVCLV